MKHCIDINHFKVKELASELQLPKIVVAAKIALWQQQNNSDGFPNIENFGNDISKLNDSQENASKIYSKLGNKTKNDNIIIRSVYQQEGVQYAKSIGGVFSLRLNNTNNHFGNPFSSVESEIQKGLIRTNSTKESVEKYISWILSDTTNINPEQHTFIREMLQSGKLKGKPIVYYKELGTPSHATALDYLINNYNWNKQIIPQQEQIITEVKDTISTSLSNKYDESGNLIGNTLGAFMNAIVDAAKDPYVARANINHFTAGTAFMLARAGVDREWIVAFIGQPILKDLVAETNKSEGRFAKDLFIKGKKIKPIDKIIEKYNLNTKDTLKNKEGNIEITTENLIKQIENPENIDPTLQGQILYQFLEWQNKAKDLGKLIALTKADVNGATRNLNRAKLYLNLYESIKSNNPFNGVDDLLGFNPDSKNMISTFIKNGPMAAREMFGSLFLQSTPAVEKIVDNILANAGYLNLLPSAPNERLLDQVSNEVYAAIVAQTTAFKTDTNEMISILYGTNGNSRYGDLTSARSKDLAKRINQAKLSGLSNNLLINALDTIISIPAEGTPCKISLPKNEATKKLKDDFYVAWEELNNIDPVLSQDLMKYAFYSSGFTGASGFYEHIPISLLEKYNFSAEITDIKNRLSNNEYSADTTIDAVFKNLYYENKLVPVVPYSKMKLIVESVEDQEITHSENDAFLLTTDDSDYIAGTDENNLPVFKRFVKTKNDTLYQLQGLLENSLGGIYVRVNTLGYKDLGRSIKEYYDVDSNTIFKPNITLPNTLATLLENSKPIPKIVGTYDNMEIPTVKDQKSINIIEKLNYCKKQ